MNLSSIAIDNNIPSKFYKSKPYQIYDSYTAEEETQNCNYTRENTLKRFNNENTNQTYQYSEKELTFYKKPSTCISRHKKLFLIIGIIVVILIILGVILICILKKSKNHDEQEIINENAPTTIDLIQKDSNHIDVKFQFKTKVKDLRSVNVKQKYTERVLTNGDETTINVNRETNYEIFILSEQEPSEINKNNYNKYILQQY